MNFLKFHLPLIAYAIVIFTFSSFSTLPEQFSEFTFQDKIMHFFEFLVLGWLLLRSARKWRISFTGASLLVAVILIGAVYAASDEFHQYFVPGRDCDIFDWTADTVGLAAGTITSYIFSRWKEKPRIDVKI
jgi:VanZ family protein